MYEIKFEDEKVPVIFNDKDIVIDGFDFRTIWKYNYDELYIFSKNTRNIDGALIIRNDIPRKDLKFIVKTIDRAIDLWRFHVDEHILDTNETSKDLEELLEESGF